MVEDRIKPSLFTTILSAVISSQDFLGRKVSKNPVPENRATDDHSCLDKLVFVRERRMLTGKSGSRRSQSLSIAQVAKREFEHSARY